MQNFCVISSDYCISSDSWCWWMDGVCNDAASSLSQWIHVYTRGYCRLAQLDKKTHNQRRSIWMICNLVIFGVCPSLPCSPGTCKAIAQRTFRPKLQVHQVHVVTQWLFKQHVFSTLRTAGTLGRLSLTPHTRFDFLLLLYCFSCSPICRLPSLTHLCADLPPPATHQRTPPTREKLANFFAEVCWHLSMDSSLFCQRLRFCKIPKSLEDIRCMLSGSTCSTVPQPETSWNNLLDVPYWQCALSSLFSPRTSELMCDGNKSHQNSNIIR